MPNIDSQIGSETAEEELEEASEEFMDDNKDRIRLSGITRTATYPFHLSPCNFEWNIFGHLTIESESTPVEMSQPNQSERLTTKWEFYK